MGALDSLLLIQFFLYIHAGKIQQRVLVVWRVFASQLKSCMVSLVLESSMSWRTDLVVVGCYRIILRVYGPVHSIYTVQKPPGFFDICSCAK